MKAALVSVSMGVMEPLLSKLSKLLEEEYGKLRGVNKQIKFLRDELSAMSPALQMLADAEQLNPQMKEWRDKVRELAYDIEDCVDAFVARVDNEDGGPSGFLGLYHKFKKLIQQHKIAKEIEELKARAIEESERHKRYNFVEPIPNFSTTCAVDPRLPALYEEIDKLMGIKDPMKRIIELLNMNTNGLSSKLKVVSLTGSGGIGKTTLAKQVYDTVKKQFSCAAFVSISRSPDMRKILRVIAKGVGFMDYTPDDDEKHLIDKLRKHMEHKRYFVVIDDVWDAEAWKFIKLALPNNDLGSRIITTTRNTAIASSFSSQCGNVYKMKPLSFDDSKRLLFKRAFGSENVSCTHLGRVPDEILRKCDGLPLAIITISSMLTDQYAKSEWDRVLNDIGSTLATNPGAERMTTILSLSYFDIPRHLRTCLLYLSVFPEDCEIEKRRVINRWIAEGFIDEVKGRSRYETGECYFTDLMNRSLLQPVDTKYGQAEKCRVHDIILDYIKCKAAEENFITSLDSAEHGYPLEHKVRRLYIDYRNKENVTIHGGLDLSHVRSLTVLGRPIQISSFHSTVLRVLDLEDFGIKDHHLSSIVKLFHLKYLRLGSHSITTLPEKLGELQYLQTLDVSDTSLKELPLTITKLQRLAYLYISSRTVFPEGMIGEMDRLEKLKVYVIRYLDQGKSLRELSKLTKLRTLDIKLEIDLADDLSEKIRQAEDISCYVGTLLSSHSLHNLSISNEHQYPLSLHSWHPAAHCSIRKLCIKTFPIYKVPDWMGTLGNLEVLELFIICVRPEDVELLGAIPSLVFLELDIIGGTNGRIIVHGNSGFRSLKYFSLCTRACGTSLEFETESMPKLEHINLEFLMHSMKCLNGSANFGIQHLSALSKVRFTIRDNYMLLNGKYDPMEADDGTIKCVAGAIKAAIETLPNRPIPCFGVASASEADGCKHFDSLLREANQKFEGFLTEWLKVWQIEENQIEQVMAAATQQECVNQARGGLWTQWVRYLESEGILPEQSKAEETKQEPHT